MHDRTKLTHEILESGLFDATWYAKTYPDVAESGLSPLDHFVRVGLLIKRSPGPAFDSRFYLDRYKDVQAAGVPAVLHYLRNGRAEGRTPVPGTGTEAGTSAKPVALVAAAKDAGSAPCSPDAPRWVLRSGLDAFMLRGLEPLAPSAVVVNAATQTAWQAALGALSKFGKDDALDLFLLGPVAELDLTDLPDSVRAVTDLGAADEPGNAKGFVRTAVSGCLDSYNALLWVSPADGAVQTDTSPDDFAAAADWGWAAPRSVSLNPKDGADTVRPLINALKTALPRLGLSLADAPLDLPDGGAVWIKPILLRVLGPTVRPFEMTADGKTGFPGRATVLAMLAAAAREAGMMPVRPASSPAVPASRDVKAVAFYLPQFHPIPENDTWWGKGFTEWSNVTRGKQLFRNHYQPRVPTDLGYYDLRLEDVQAAQGDLARNFGIHGFCYYYYWFNGKKLLNQPIEQMARSTRTDASFCVCWANENWSRNWDGQNRHVLMKQDYSLDSNIALIRELIPMMKDPRWVRYNGKPVMLVYRISIIPNWAETARRWREECRAGGLGEIHLCAVRFGLESLAGQPQDHGLDSYVLFPPHEAPRKDLRKSVLDLHKDFGGEIFDYSAVVDGDIQKYAEGYDWPVHRGAMLGWDNTARRLTDARIFHGATPYGFRRWVKTIIEQEARFNSGPESLVFINAWNEWAEGTYLEPDQRWGRSNLAAVRSAVDAVPGTRAVVTPRGTASATTAKALVQQGNPLDRGAAALRPPVWNPGARPHDPNLPTVLLCAHISGHHLFGGERSLLDILDAMATMPLNVVVTLPSGNNRAYVDMIGKRCTGSYVFSYPQWMDNRATYGWLTNNFADIIARHGVDVVHANTIVLSEPLAAARRMGAQAVVHSRELISLDHQLQERMDQITPDIVAEVLRRADWVIGNSRATCRLFSKGDRTLYVPNAVSLSEFAMNNRFGTTIKFGIVSSNILKKGVGDFVEVARRAADRVPNARFVVVGPETEEIRQWQAEIQRGDRPGNLQFAGYRETPRKAMSELNVLLNLSQFAESFGRTLAEAMAASRPVIAYDWGALPELVRHGETGFLVPYRDIDGVVDAVQVLCDNPGRITEMAAAGLDFVAASFTQDALCAALADGYERILGRPMRRAGGVPQLQAADDRKTVVPAAVAVGQAPRTTVVIPVYNAPDEVRDCVESVIRHTDLTRDRVLVINDASPAPSVAPMLAGFVGQAGLQILHNTPNLGYTNTVNRGLTEAGQDDVVLLNSDTIVTPKWLEGLRATAYSRPKVATVTAMSDNAGAFSFPRFNEYCPRPAHLSHDEYALLMVQATQGCAAPVVPTGSGFCMYIRRALIDACGQFDHAAFPRGYGEENDFCMRARAAGWENLISPWSFVYHIRTASFKSEKAALVKAGVDVVTRRYPDYAGLVRAAFDAPEMHALRKASTL